MKNCDMIGALGDGTTVNVNDYYSLSHDPPSTDESLGGQDNIKNQSGGYANKNINVTFTRLLNTGDKFDSVIVPDVRQSICWAYLNNDPEWVEHSNESNF
jgi:DOMON domain